MTKDKESVMRRLKTIEGHLRAVQRMVDEEQYCIDIIHQTQAVKKALDKVEEEILANHLAGCVTTAMRGEDAGERERVVAELMDVFTTNNKR